MKLALKIVAGMLLGLVLFATVWCFAYPRLFPDRMRANAARIQMMFLAGAATESYRFEGKWPASIEQLIAHPDVSGNMAMFLKAGTNDPWGHPIVLEPFDPARGYGRIISYGADGLPGGQGNGMDIITHYGEHLKLTDVHNGRGSTVSP